MKRLALALIALYQRRISPYKGFGCACRTHTGRAGCSGLGYRAISRFGLVRGLLVLRTRLIKCGVAFRRLVPHAPALRAQAGFCDLPVRHSQSLRPSCSIVRMRCQRFRLWWLGRHEPGQ